MSFQVVPGWRKNLASVAQWVGAGMIGASILDIWQYSLDHVGWVFCVGPILFLVGMIGGSQFTLVRKEGDQ